MARLRTSVARDATPSQSVLMVAPAFPPSTAAGVHRTVRFARMLPEFGWRPVVLTMPSKDRGSLPAWLDELRVERVSGWGQNASALGGGQRPVAMESDGEPGSDSVRGGARRGLKQVVRCARSLLLETPDREVAWALPARSIARRLANEESVDAVYTSGPPHSAHLVGLNLRRRLGLPWVADFRDPWARKPWGHKARNPWGQRLLGYFERRCVQAADVIILNTDRMADEFRRHYASLPSGKFIAIPNGCDPELLERSQSLIEAAARDRSDRRSFHLCHVGSLYSRRDPRPLIDALQLLRQQGHAVTFEQVGGSKPEFQLTEYARERGVEDRVIVEPPVPHEEALRRMAAADVQLLIQPGTDTQVPGKLFEMLAFRKPILALADPGATSDIVRKYRLGQVISSQNVAGIATAILSLMMGTASTAGADWRAACHDFDGRQLTGRLAEQLDALCCRPSAPTIANPHDRITPVEVALR